MQLGFSYVGFIYLLLLIGPNLAWCSRKPRDYETYVCHENRLLVALERTGEALTSCTVLIFSDFNLRAFTAWSGWLLASAALMLLYEIYWLRYFTGRRTMADFYGNMLGIPVPGATLPVAAFFLLGIYGRNPILLLAVTVLGVGHIGIHWNHKREIAAPSGER